MDTRDGGTYSGIERLHAHGATSIKQGRGDGKSEYYRAGYAIMEKEPALNVHQRMLWQPRRLSLEGTFETEWKGSRAER